MKPETKVTRFLEANPNSTKTAIAEATSIKGLQLYNLLKALVKGGAITALGDGEETTYSLAIQTEEINEETSALQEQPQSDAKPVEEPAEKQPDAVKPTPATSVIKDGARNNDKFKFNGQEYGKGPLVRAVVTQYVADNPGVTYKKLKEVFPDNLLKRFGIFEEEAKAREISDKYDRYFFKVEHLIKLKDKKVVVCNQFTLTNIQPFLLCAKELGYKIK